MYSIGIAVLIQLFTNVNEKFFFFAYLLHNKVSIKRKLNSENKDDQFSASICSSEIGLTFFFDQSKTDKN